MALEETSPDGHSSGVTEFEEVQTGDPLRQGDVVVETAESAAAEGYIVVTADCDLTHNKFGGRLTALPLVSLEHYLRDFWLERELLSHKDQLASQLQEEMRRLIRMSPHDYPEPSPERLLDWPLTASAEELAKTLGLDVKDLADLSELVSTLGLIEKSDKLSLRAKWRTFAEVMYRNNIKTRERARATLVKRVSKELPRQLPGDVLYLHRPLGATRTGFIALARFPVEIDPNAIACTSADVVYGEATHRRVGRLGSPYRYRLTQLFAEIYSAIGLPREYEASRSERFEELAERVDRELSRQ